MENKIIPSINCSDFSCIKKRIELVSTFLNAENENWIHIDVSDGKFTLPSFATQNLGGLASHVYWNNPEELGNWLQFKEVRLPNNLRKSDFLNIEVHLMIENPETYIVAWLKAGAKRIIVHLEVMQDSVLILEKCKKYSAECFLAIKPETEVDRLFAYVSDPRTESPIHQLSDESILATKDSIDTSNIYSGALVRGSALREARSLSAGSEALHFDGFLILGVSPGPSGQQMDERIFEKIKKLRNRFQESIIEVDGGINLETVKLASQAGANLFVVGNYIFGSKNPKEAYEELNKIIA